MNKRAAVEDARALLQSYVRADELLANIERVVKQTEATVRALVCSSLNFCRMK